jgi:hypothetical protein
MGPLLRVSTHSMLDLETERCIRKATIVPVEAFKDMIAIEGPIKRENRLNTK